MIKPIKNTPECIYGNPCSMVCINSQCRKPGFVCESGLKNKNCCSLFHDKCEKMQWSELENIVCQNPNTKIPQFYRFQEEVQNFFGVLIKRVKEEHLAFRKWVRVFGFSPQMMNFINMVNEANYNNISGVYMNQILSALFMNQEKHIDSHFSADDCPQIQKQIDEALVKVKELYNIQQKKSKVQKLSASMSTGLSTTLQNILDSKITQEFDYIKSLFAKQNLKKMTLIYRASQHNFSAAQFHKMCDAIPNTVTLIQTQYGKIIGGFTPLPWNSSKKHWAADKSMTSFLFSVDLRQKFNLNLAQFAVACNPEKGPIFGCCDICIVDGSNIQKSNAQFPISYNNFKYMRNSESSQAFTGNAKGRFTTREWEVFRVEFSD